MKKFIVIIMICVMVFGMSACSVEYTAEEDKQREPIGYAIVSHYDGDEHVEFYRYTTNNGLIIIRTLDGRTITSNNITLIIY
jgi:hypothetical protein